MRVINIICFWETYIRKQAKPLCIGYRNDILMMHLPDTYMRIVSGSECVHVLTLYDMSRTWIDWSVGTL